MHIHAVDARLPGGRPKPDLLYGPPEPVADALRRQMQESGTDALLGMGHLEGSGDDPLGIASTLRISEFLPALHAIGIADPSRTDTDHLQRVERQLQSGKVIALKGYLGYLYYGPDSPAYVPYYELAARYQLPFIFHTGDNYSDVAKVKYAHPLLVDEVAVDHRGVNFVMAHFGNPWIADAAEVAYKNENVWADLSGLLIGDEDYFAQLTARGVAADGGADQAGDRVHRTAGQVPVRHRLAAGPDARVPRLHPPDVPGRVAPGGVPRQREGAVQTVKWWCVSW